MKNCLKILSIEEVDEKAFLDFLNRDQILHIFTIYDLKFMRDKTKVWIAFKNDDICGYAFEFDRRIVHTHGTVESVAKLLDYIALDEVVFVVEPDHLAVIEKVFEPIGPTDTSSKGKVTTYLVMKLDPKIFKPIIKHRVKKLGFEDLDDVLERFGEDEKRRVEEAVRGGLAYGAYEGGLLSSLATVPEIIDDVALVRGVYTFPSLRNRGLATSVCSVLSKELLSLGKKVILWVAKDNLPARKVYEKIGFRKTDYTLLGFKARRIRK